MNADKLKELLTDIENGKISADEAIKNIRSLSDSDLGYAKVDHHRSLRQGASEVIYAEKKTVDQIIGIIRAMLKEGERGILLTRLSQEAYDELREHVSMDYDSISRTAIVGERKAKDGRGYILIATGGTSDIPVAEEAARTAEFLGNEVRRLYDVGVAGIHRVLSRQQDIIDAQVIIAVAGMEGALASVIGGLSSVPVIAVPTSVGYGASFGGLSSLLSMLNSCASGVSVVNIDNGFGAGYIANMINHAGL